MSLPHGEPLQAQQLEEQHSCNVVQIEASVSFELIINRCSLEKFYLESLYLVYIISVSDRILDSTIVVNLASLYWSIILETTSLIYADLSS